MVRHWLWKREACRVARFIEPAAIGPLVAVGDLRRCADARLRSANDDVNAGINWQCGAVDHQVVQAGIVLTHLIEEACVPLARTVNILLILSRRCLVDPLRDRLSDSPVDRSVEPDAEDIVATAEDDHAGTTEDHRAGGVGNLSHHRLGGGSKGVWTLERYRRYPHRRRYRVNAREGAEELVPPARRPFVVSLDRFLREPQVPGHRQRDGSVEKGQPEAFGDALSHGLAASPVRC